MKNKDYTKRNFQIEGLRGITCILLVLWHVIYRYNQIYYAESNFFSSLKMFSIIGEAGSICFLIISIWFMIDSNRKLNEEKTVVSILYKKWMRLWRPYLLSISITFGLSRFLALPGRSVDVTTYLINLSMLEGFIPGINYVDGAHWYITTLLVIIFWVTVIEKIFKGNPFGYIFWLILSENMEYIPYGLFLGNILQCNYVNIILLVIMLKKVYLNIIDKKPFRMEEKIEVILLFINFVLILFRHDIWYTLHIILVLTLIICCMKNKIPIFENKFLVSIGNISYYLYLIHQNVSYMIQNLLVEWFGDYRIWYCIPAFCVVFLLAIFIKKFNENVGKRYI